MEKFDLSKTFVDRSNHKRLYFFSELSKILVMYDSTNEEVNDLIYYLYCLCNSPKDIEPRRSNIEYSYDLKPDKKFDENTFIRNVWNHDMIIYSIVSSVHENGTWCIKDSLSEIIKEIYFLLEKIIYPNYRPGLDYNDTGYYVEVEYISKDQQKELEEEHDIKFNEENWRA